MALSLAVGLVLLELLLRALLFFDFTPFDAWGEPLRRAGLYTHGPQGEEYWKLDTIFHPEDAALVHGRHDPRLGWIPKLIQPGTFRHMQEGRLPGKRPVLFYGDSYTGCTTGREFCWERQLERSELADELCMLNYGVGGFGLDQTYLLVEGSIDNYRERDPIVIVGVLLDDDLDRAFLGLRSFPKPRLEVRDDELIAADVPLESAAGYVARHPLGIPSYLWRFVKYGSGLVPHRLEELPEKRALNRRIVEELVAVLQSRDLDLFFVLFHGDRTTRHPDVQGWQERLMRETLTELDVPFVSSLDALLADSQATGTPLPEYFRHNGRLIRHYPPRTNEVVFPLILKELKRISQ